VEDLALNVIVAVVTLLGAAISAYYAGRACRETEQQRAIQIETLLLARDSRIQD
jgi:hypothetical protein